QRLYALWFSNDTVVLRAEDRGFRVTKAILAARSSVFQAMFEFPQPTSDVDDTMDGSPVVLLHDSAVDVEAFLHAIFDSSYFMPPPAAIDFHAVLGILRLSHKYNVDYLHKRALHHLETVYPTQVTDYQAILTNNLHYKSGLIALDLKAIPILQEVGAIWLLPCAFYSVGTYPAETLLSAGDAWSNLSPETKQTCLLLHPYMVRWTYQLLQILEPSAANCISQDPCDSVRRDTLMACVWDHAADQIDQDPMSEWDAREWDSLQTQLCPDCFTRAREEHDFILTGIWERLPGICGLDEWVVLR
ncbi:hypothetical protein FB451DRAFT_1537771, partial [Mycena latifolia]